MFYRLARPLLFLFDPEFIHERAMNFCRSSSENRLIERLFRNQFSEEFEELKTSVGNLELANPVGLAAGLDKNGVAASFFQNLGFGHLEAGTATPRPQPGNPRPRLFRLPEDQAVLNRLGFNNHGVEALTEALGAVNRVVPLGVNLGKNKDTPLEKATDDYLLGLEKAWDQADYFTINVSSPNTPGLRDLQAESFLKPMLKAILDRRDELGGDARTSAVGKPTAEKPVWLKIAPDLSDEQLEAVCGIVSDLGIDALVAGNTTISRPDLRNPRRAETGGLSGKPLFRLANDSLLRCHRYTSGKVPLVGVGGVFSGADAFEKISLGASAVQIYTGFIYGGPGAPSRIKRELVRILAAQGYRNLSEAVGCAVGAKLD